MFNSVSLQSIRSHADTTIKLGRLTVFVGPNGTGKSTVLGMIERVCSGVLGTLATGSGDWRLRDGYAPQRLLRSGAERQWSSSVALSSPALAIRVRCAADPRGDWKIEATINDRALLGVVGNPPAPDFVRNLREGLATLCLTLDASKIASKVHLSTPNQGVGSSGAHTVLQLMNLAQRRRPDAYQAVIRDLKSLVTHLESVRAVVTTGDDAGVQLVYDFTDADDVPASAVSEGTLLATALLTALHGDDQPRVLLLDDIERGLHPSAQIRFMQQLKALLEAQPQLQIIATTHSPFILDALEPSQVRVFARRKDGSVAVKSLAEHPMAKENEGALTTGQLWSLDDESSWVLRPEERGQ